MSLPEWSSQDLQPSSTLDTLDESNDHESQNTSGKSSHDDEARTGTDVAYRNVMNNDEADSSDHLNLDEDAPQNGEDSGSDRQHRTADLDSSIRSLSLLPTSEDSAPGSTTRKSARPGKLRGDLQVGDSANETYLDPTPKTPRQNVSPSRPPLDPSETADEGASTFEIQSIMDQFDDDEEDREQEELVSTGQSHGQPLLTASLEHPPRRSSLEPLGSTSPRPNTDSMPETVSSQLFQDARQNEEINTADSQDMMPPMRVSSLPRSARFEGTDSNMPPSSHSSKSLPKMPPPAPDPEPDLPFDFHRFLEQLRHRTADPVAKFLRSFLIEFGKKLWMVHEQVKIINDFLTFITNKMAQCEVWRGVSDAEFDNAKEGMEKLVMNRLYSQTFSPAIPPPTPVPGSKGKKKNFEKLLGSGRRGQHQEDIERDEILGQKVRIYGWVQEAHLDIPPVSDSGRRFLILAQQELLKIKTYRAPRDKVICVLNCCKVIFGLLRNSKSPDTSADSFVPLLIYVVLHASPDHLVSNVQYILRFRNQDKLGGEAGYYLSSLMGVIQFIENLDRTSLTVSDGEFEENVEAAVSVIAERHKEEMPSPIPRPPRPLNNHQISEKSGLSQPEVIPRNSIEAEYISPRKSPSLRGKAEEFGGSDGTEENSAVSGLLRTIQRPLSSLGRMFNEEPETLQQLGPQRATNQPPRPQRLSPAVFLPPRNSEEGVRANEEPKLTPESVNMSETKKLNAEDAAARQASAEAEEAQRIQRAEHVSVVETLAGMFPDLDKDVIDDVVRMKQGRVGLAVDACLALSN